MIIAVSVVIFAIAIVLQLTLLPLFAIKGVTPDLILIVVIVTSLKKNRIWGMIGGFGAGLVYDFFGTGFIGLSSLAYSLAAFAVGLWSEQQERRLGAVLGPLFLNLLVHDLVYYLVLRVGTSVGFWLTIFTVVLPATIYSLVFLSILYLATPSVLIGKRAYY